MNEWESLHTLTKNNPQKKTVQITIMIIAMIAKETRKFASAELIRLGIVKQTDQLGGPPVIHQMSKMAQPAEDSKSTSSVATQQSSSNKENVPQNHNQQFCVRDLYGGAFQISLPKQFVDLSNFRLVPDHQEVWSDAHRDQSIIIELVELVENQKDENAAKYHFNDIAETSNSMETKIVSSGVFAANTLSVATKYHCSWTFGTQKVSKGRDGTDKANVIALYLVLIRLKEFGTDLLISFNAPIKIHEESQAKCAKEAVQSPQVSLQLFKQIVSTFTVKDLSIFNTEE